MDTFAFIIHPIDPKRDISRKYPLLGRIATDWMIDHIAPLFPPVYLSEVDGITSISTGKQIKGWLIACPLTPQHFWGLPEKRVYRKIIDTGHLAERLGAKILGLGAFTSVIGDAGLTVSRNLQIPVTTGDSYTVAIAVKAVKEAARLVAIPLEGAVTAVVGAAGSIGKVCSQLLATEVAEIILIGRDQKMLEIVKSDLISQGARSHILVTTNLDDLKKANLILTVTSAVQTVIEPAFLAPGSVVCDVARPRDVAAQVKSMRQDVLVIDGGIVDVPGDVKFNFDFGFPPGKAYACMAETIALALEGRFEDFTVGKNITLEKVNEITEISERHGFKLSGFRSFEQPVSQTQIDYVRQQAQRFFRFQ